MLSLSYRVGTLALAAVALTACEDGVGPDSTARVTVVNATNAQLDVLTDGQLSPANARLNFAGGSRCLVVDPTNTGLSLRESNSLLTVTTFNSAFEPGGTHTVIATQTTTGVFSTLTLSNLNTPLSGNGGLRVVNAGGGTQTYDVYVTDPGVSLSGQSARGSSLASGQASSFFSVTAGTPQQVRLTTAGTTTTAIDVGTHVFEAGQNVTLVIGPPAPGSSVRRTFFIVHNC